MLKSLLDRIVRHGRLTVVTPLGTVVSGQCDPRHHAALLDVRIRIKSAAAALKVATNPDLYFGEAYVDGDLVIEQGSLWDLMELIGYNIHLLAADPNPLLGRLATKASSILAYRNGPDSARKNVAHHYDLSGDLYRLFLDDDLQYSCAYFRDPDDTIDAAQLSKKQHIAAKLALQPGQRGARHRLRLGWPGAHAGQDGRRRGAGHHAVGRAARRGAAAGQGRRARQSRPLRADRLPQSRRPLRPHRLDRDVRACRDAAVRHLFRSHQAVADAIGGRPSSIRSARCTVRLPPVPGS